MAANDKTDGPSKAEFEKLQRLVAQLMEANRKLERRVVGMDERLRNAQANIQRLSRQ